ncbi:MAG: chorismate mutase [Actinomycetota bacterium]|nr:chorismate mutase [Actinomycetota bacterium]
MSTKGLRGATTLEEDSREEIIVKTKELLGAMIERNGLDKDDFVTLIFTATSDVHGAFPAAAAREMGFGDVPLICAQELEIVDSTPLCIRILALIDTDKARSELRHIYLHGAKGLRDDLPS